MHPTKEKEPITEFYTSKEVQEKYGVSNSGMYKIAEREGWPKTQSRGKTLWSRSHVDRDFASQQPKEEISEWYTVADIQARYGMTLSAIYTLVSRYPTSPAMTSTSPTGSSGNDFMKRIFS